MPLILVPFPKQLVPSVILNIIEFELLHPAPLYIANQSFTLPVYHQLRVKMLGYVPYVY